VASVVKNVGIAATVDPATAEYPNREKSVTGFRAALSSYRKQQAK